MSWNARHRYRKSHVQAASGRRCGRVTGWTTAGRFTATIPAPGCGISQNHSMATRRVGLQIEDYELGHLRLYRDDLEKIAKAVAEIGELVIRCGDWEMTEPADFSDNTELPDLLPELEIEGRGQSAIDVRLGPNTASVTLVEPDTLTEGILSRIRRIAGARRRRLPLVSVRGAHGYPYFQVSIPTSSAVLINAYRADRPSFWQRTRDDWFIGTVMLLLGGVLGYIVNMIT